MRTLAALVSALPPELVQEIYDWTFKISSDEYVFVRASKPPRSLQVDRASREKLAELYYTNSIFYTSKADLASWLHSLSSEHISLLQEIRISDVGMVDFEASASVPPKLSSTGKGEVLDKIMDVYETLPATIQDRFAPYKIKLEATPSGSRQSWWVGLYDVFGSLSANLSSRTIRHHLPPRLYSKWKQLR